MPPPTPPPRFYYGWVIAAIAAVAAVATMPGQSVLVGMFNAPIREALDLSVSEISTAYMIGTLVAALPLTMVGTLADRYGVRIVMGCVAALFALALVGMGFVAGIVTLTLGFFAIRFLGQGSLGMLSGHAVAMWFERRLATVTSAKLIMFSLGAAALPTPTVWLIDQVGWRSAYPILGAGVAVSVLPLVVLLYRNTPEDVGQHLDGDTFEHDPENPPPPPDDPAFTLGEALRTWAYWVLVPISVLNGLIGTAFVFHIEGMLSESGVSAEAMVTAKPIAIAAWPVCSAAAMIVGGVLADRVKARWLMPFSPGLLALSCVLWVLSLKGILPGLLPISIAMGVFGVSQGIGVSVGHPAIARYFGRLNHGAIRGSASTAGVAGTAAGPAMAGIAFDQLGGTFVPAMIGFCVMTLPLALAATTLKPPSRPERGPSQSAG